MQFNRRAATLLFALLSTANVFLAASINFDSLGDGEQVTNQFAGQGVSFQNAIALVSGISINEFEFPPLSNFNVVSDDGGPLSVVFATPQTSVFAFFTYSQSITMHAYDSLNTALGAVSSAAGCESNLALSGTQGCTPNEQLSLSGIGAISRVTITGAVDGGSFVMDDFNFTSDPSSPEIPEPSSFILFAGGLAALAAILRRP